MDQHYRNQESMCEKVSSSIKKSHKISIYSRRSNKSPKKSDLSLHQLTANTQQAYSLGYTNQHSTQMNSAKNQFHQTITNDHNNNNQQWPLSQYRTGDKVGIMKQLPYPQQNDASDFFNQQQETAIARKPKSFINNPNNISDMIDKQAESQTNNLSVLQGSFLTGNKGITPNINMHNKQSQNSIASSGINNNPEQKSMMSAFMNFLHEQITVAKDNYQQKFNLVLKNNVHTIKELQSRLYQNHVLIKEKTQEIERLRDVIKRSGDNNSKRINSEGKEMRSDSVGVRQQTVTENKVSNVDNNLGYYSKRINDLQTKLSLLQSFISKPQQTQRIQSKLQLLQHSLIRHMSSKLNSLSSTLQSFITSSNTKLFTLYQSLDTISATITNFQTESKKIGFNQNKIKQLTRKLGELDEEMKSFLEKQFKYENYGVQELKEWVGKVKERVREFEGFQLQNAKLLKQLGDQLIKAKKVATSKDQSFQKKQQENILISLSQAHETMSKYSQSHPNLNENLQLSNAHEFSHLLQKLNPHQNNNDTVIEQKNNILMYRNTRINNNVTTSQSLISMNFTEQEIEQSVEMQSSLKEKGVRYEDKGESQIRVSKYTKATTQMMKQTSTTNLNINSNSNNLQPSNTNFNKNPFNNSPSSITTATVSKLSMPVQNNFISIQSILSPLVSCTSTQQKIRNLSQLKMENKQRLSVISSSLDHDQSSSQGQQTPRSPLTNNSQTLTHTHLQQPLSIQNNTSYLSIGQLQDYHQSFEQHLLLQRQSNNKFSNNLSCDWSDDEFFYPQYQDSDKKESNVQLYNWERSHQKFQSREDLGSSSSSPIYHKINHHHNNKSDELYSPLGRKLSATEANFYQSMKYSNQNQTTHGSPQNQHQKLTKSKSGEQQHNHQQLQSKQRKKLIYSGNFDYQRFSDSDDEEKGMASENDSFGSPTVSKKHSNSLGMPLHLTKFPPQSHTPKIQQKPPHIPEPFTANEQKLIEKCKLLQKSQLPLKLIYDRKKCQGIAKMHDPSHQLHGKTFTLQKKSIQKLQNLGFIHVKTYI